MGTTRFFHSMAKKRRLFADRRQRRVRDSTEGKRETSNLWCLRTDETIPVARPSRARRMAETGRVKLVRFYTVKTKSEPTQKVSENFPTKIKGNKPFPAAGILTTSSRTAPTVRTIAGGRRDLRVNSRSRVKQRYDSYRAWQLHKTVHFGK